MIILRGKDGDYSVYFREECLDRFSLRFQPGNSTYLLKHYEPSIKQTTVLEVIRDEFKARDKSHLEALIQARKRAGRIKKVVDRSDMAKK